MSQIYQAVKYALTGIRARAEQLSVDKNVEQAFENVRDAFQMLGKRLSPGPKPEDFRSYVEPQIERVKTSFLSGDSAHQLVVNLSLVMLCTQLELFINHLIDTILETEPRRIMDLFPEKKINAKEAVEVGSYVLLMQRIRDKIVDEIERSGAREKFVKYLDEKFKILDGFATMAFLSPAIGSPMQADVWDLNKLERIFDQRHRIVHRGELPVTDLESLLHVYVFFRAIQIVLTINAVRKYNLKLDDAASAKEVLISGRLFGVHHRHLEEFEEKVRAMFPEFSGP